MSVRTEVKKMKDAAKGGNVIGALAWWSVEGIKVSHGQLEKLMKDYDLDATFMPPDLSGEATFGKAIGRANASVTKRGRRAYDMDRKQMMLRKIVETSSVVVYGVVEESAVVKSEDLKYRRVANVRYHRDTRTIEFRGTHSLLDTVKTQYSALRGKYSSRDISKQMISNIREVCQGIPVRARGGVYFVPPRHISTVTKLMNVLAQLGTSTGTVLSIAEGHGNAAAIRENAAQSLTNMVEDFKGEVKRFKKDGARPSTLARRIKTMKTMKNKIIVYAEALGMKLGGLTGQVDRLSKDVNEMIRERLGQ